MTGHPPRTMDWRQFVMNLDALNPDSVEEVLLRNGAQSVTLSDAGDHPVLEPAPGETPLWSDTCITGLFGDDADLPALVDDLKDSLGLDELPRHEIQTLADRAWEREWLKDFHAMRFGDRLWVCPGDLEPAADDAVVVRLDPGLAFGTGTHATTALCLEWLDGLDLDGATLLDYGCGSGVLAIAGLRLGCRQAVALDIDPQAVTATRANAARNDVAGRLVASTDPGAVAGKYDVVVANILAGPLEMLAESIATCVKSGGRLALSGILQEQVGEIMSAYDRWIEFEPPGLRQQEQQTWARLCGVRREDD